MVTAFYVFLVSATSTRVLQAWQSTEGRTTRFMRFSQVGSNLAGWTNLVPEKIRLRMAESEDAKSSDARSSSDQTSEGWVKLTPTTWLAL